MAGQSIKGSSATLNRWRYAWHKLELDHRIIHGLLLGVAYIVAAMVLMVFMTLWCVMIGGCA